MLILQSKDGTFHAQAGAFVGIGATPSKATANLVTILEKQIQERDALIKRLKARKLTLVKG